MKYIQYIGVIKITAICFTRIKINSKSMNCQASLNDVKLQSVAKRRFHMLTARYCNKINAQYGEDLPKSDFEVVLKLLLPSLAFPTYESVYELH